MALHWLAPVAFTIKRKACLIPWEIVFLWWIIDNNRWQSFGGNCYFWLSSLDFTQTSELRGSETDVERACRLYIPASLPCLVISVASTWTRVHSIPQRKMFLFFFFSASVRIFFQRVERWNEMQQIGFALATLPGSRCCGAGDRRLTPTFVKSRK